MSDRIAPAQKSVPRRDGFKIGGDKTCLTTASDNEGNVWNNNGEQGMSIFNSKVGEGTGPHNS